MAFGKSGYDSTLILRCNECKKRYDLCKEKRLAERKRKKEINCPHCQAKIGELS